MARPMPLEDARDVELELGAPVTQPIEDISLRHPASIAKPTARIADAASRHGQRVSERAIPRTDPCRFPEGNLRDHSAW